MSESPPELFDADISVMLEEIGNIIELDDLATIEMCGIQWWVLGFWPVCTCGGADNEAGHEVECDCYP